MPMLALKILLVMHHVCLMFIDDRELISTFMDDFFLVGLLLEQERGGSPVPVVTRTMQRAKREKFDVVIIDTAGRLSNNFELTEQLQLMKQAIQQEVPEVAPHETLLVVDGSLGRNAVEQANVWRKYVGISGLVVTKLDGTARA